MGLPRRQAGFPWPGAGTRWRVRLTRDRRAAPPRLALARCNPFRRVLSPSAPPSGRFACVMSSSGYSLACVSHAPAPRMTGPFSSGVSHWWDARSAWAALAFGASRRGFEPNWTISRLRGYPPHLSASSVTREMLATSEGAMASRSVSSIALLRLHAAGSTFHILIMNLLGSSSSA
jgi:hypothetical protein